MRKFRRGFPLVCATVLLSIAIGVGVESLAYRPIDSTFKVAGTLQSVVTTDVSGKALPSGALRLARSIVDLARVRDRARLINLTDLGITNNSAGLELGELLDMRGGFRDLIDVMTTSRAMPSSILTGYVWGADSYLEGGELSPAKNVQPLQYGGLVVSLGKNQGTWEFEVDEPLAETFTDKSHFRWLVGEWFAHGSGFVINPDGSFVITTRDACGKPSCEDHVIGNEIIGGGNSTGQVVSIAKSSAVIDVTTTVEEAPSLGRQTLTYDKQTDTISLGPGDYWCGVRSPSNYCGA